MFDVLRFWLDRGVDGFRLDAISRLIKDDQFRDNPLNPEWQPGQNPYRELLQLHSADQPEVHDILARMRRFIDLYGDRVMIGEAYLPQKVVVSGVVDGDPGTAVVGVGVGLVTAVVASLASPPSSPRIAMGCAR